VHGAVKAHDVVPQDGAPGGDHDFHAQILAHLLANLRGLEGQLAGGDQNQGWKGGVHTLVDQRWKGKHTNMHSAL